MKTAYFVFNVLALTLCFFLSSVSELLLTALAALLHELGHLIALFIFGEGVERIRFSPCGLEIKTKRRSAGTLKAIAGYLSGPAVNLALFLVFSHFSGVLLTFSLCNLLLFLINILPVRALDGGEALGCALERLLSPEKAEKICRITSFATIVLLWIPASYIFMLSGVNCSLFMIAIVLFEKIFLSD